MIMMSYLYCNSHMFCVLLFFFIITDSSVISSSSTPKALVLRVTKDLSTHQYITSVNQRTPSKPVNLTLDLGGQYLWVDCETSYVSSSYKTIGCTEKQCALAGARLCTGDCFSNAKPGCDENPCNLVAYNSVSGKNSGGELAQDIVSVKFINYGKKNPTGFVSVGEYLFECSPSYILEGLANGVEGMAGLGRTKVSLPSQFSSVFGFHRKFAFCLSSSNGFIFFGDRPYIDSLRLIYTPLILNPASSAEDERQLSAEYFIGVKSIKVNGKLIPLNKTLLSINKNGHGGTKISTVDPYTVLETSIYKAIVKAFVKETRKYMIRTAAVAPFGACFKSTDRKHTGVIVPAIDLVLQKESIYWRVHGANLMVRVSTEVVCLGFVDGGLAPVTSIVIGGYQMEDNLLEFDVTGSKLGFSSSLLLRRRTTCSDFNFPIGY